jgi:hypothetical protein
MSKEAGSIFLSAGLFRLSFILKLEEFLSILTSCQIFQKFKWKTEIENGLISLSIELLRVLVPR